MKLLDVLTAPWAIEPAKLLEIQAIYATHLRGDKIDLAGVEQRLGRPLANEPKAYDVIDGVAVLPIEGVIAKRANLFSQISGGVSTELVGRDVRAALNDASVHSIILSIDSPGGTVDGTQALAAIISAAKATKPVVALASGTMASAAYWIGSAAQAVYIADATTIVGSIGVVASHKDISGAESQAGIKTTEVYAGQYKRVASSYAPLTDAGRQSIQDQVDYTYSLFVADVAMQRGVSEKKVLKDMADGRVFMGQQAIDAGLVDGVSTLDALVAQLNADRNSGQSTQSRAGAAQPTQPKPQANPQGNAMNAEELASAHPEAAAALRAQGADAERARIQAVEGQLIPGHEALIGALKFDGKSGAGDAALAVLAAEKQTRTAAATALANDAPLPLASATPPVVTAPKELSRTEIDSQAKAYARSNPGVSYVEAVKHITQGA
ncbi:MAG: signal peptide peptidase SppA [Polaromonas sp.]|nr:signal peptide peptidase SppA [Polaromonas sp.]